MCFAFVEPHELFSLIADGAAPPTISETATTATAANNAKTGGATSLLSVNFVVAVAASTLVIVSSAFAVLA
jgi:hypothetical protein